MKMKKSLLIASLSSILLTNPSYAEEIGIDAGPFDLHFSESFSGFNNFVNEPNRVIVLDSPICRAILQQKKLEFIVETRDKINDKEMKITTKRVTVEPYAFGFTKDHQPVLRGTVIDEKLIREISIKFGEDVLAQKSNQNQKNTAALEVKNKDEDQNSNSFSSLFRSHKSKDNVESLNLRKVIECVVLLKIPILMLQKV